MVFAIFCAPAAFSAKKGLDCLMPLARVYCDEFNAGEDRLLFTIQQLSRYLSRLLPEVDTLGCVRVIQLRMKTLLTLMEIIAQRAEIELEEQPVLYSQDHMNFIKRHVQGNRM